MTTSILLLVCILIGIVSGLRSMMGVAQLRVPLEVEVGLGQSWAEAH